MQKEANVCWSQNLQKYERINTSTDTMLTFCATAKIKGLSTWDLEKDWNSA